MKSWKYGVVQMDAEQLECFAEVVTSWGRGVFKPRVAKMVVDFGHVWNILETISAEGLSHWWGFLADGMSYPWNLLQSAKWELFGPRFWLQKCRSAARTPPNSQATCHIVCLSLLLPKEHAHCDSFLRPSSYHFVASKMYWPCRLNFKAIVSFRKLPACPPPRRATFSMPFGRLISRIFVVAACCVLGAMVGILFLKHALVVLVSSMQF